jgi:hypothetical protein
MATLLLGVRTQLTSLQSLTLELCQSWLGAGMAFAELAAMTQLTKLVMTTPYRVCAPASACFSCLTA